MFRCFVLVALYPLFCLLSVAQATADRPSIPASSAADPYSHYETSARSRGASNGPISVKRLKVPHKARQFYEKAYDAWIKHESGEAQQNVELALKIDPTFPEALTLYGNMQAARQEWKSAEQTLQTAIQSDPSFSPAYVILAGLYNAESRFDEAKDVTQQALSAGATTWPVKYEIARSFIGKGDYESALAITEAALQSKHGSLIHLARAHALLGLRRYPEADSELKTYLHDDPSGDGSQGARDLLERLQSILSR